VGGKINLGLLSTSGCCVNVVSGLDTGHGVVEMCVKHQMKSEEPAVHSNTTAKT